MSKLDKAEADIGMVNKDIETLHNTIDDKAVKRPKLDLKVPSFEQLIIMQDNHNNYQSFGGNRKLAAKVLQREPSPSSSASTTTANEQANEQVNEQANEQSSSCTRLDLSIKRMILKVQQEDLDKLSKLCILPSSISIRLVCLNIKVV